MEYNQNNFLKRKKFYVIKRNRNDKKKNFKLYKEES